MSDTQDPIPAPAEQKKETRRRWRFQYSLRTLLIFVSIVSVLCSVGVCTHWIVPVELSAIAVSVTLLATVTARASATFARIAFVAAQNIGIGINLIYLICALLCALIGLIHGTDTSADFNNFLALVGFSCAPIALINCLALLVSRLVSFKAILPIAAVGNCVTLFLATMAFACPEHYDIRGVEGFVIFYSLSFISINAITVRVTYLVRFKEGT
ncbi:MAG: hypothetical protein ABSA26_02070 [Thermoguttaceae bacterium]|jgi:hypothetical protein